MKLALKVLIFSDVPRLVANHPHLANFESVPVRDRRPDRIRDLVPDPLRSGLAVLQSLDPTVLNGARPECRPASFPQLASRVLVV